MWNPSKNQVFFERAQAWARAVVNLQEERQKLIDIYTHEARQGTATDHADFVDTAICTKAELVDLATNVMTPISQLIAGTQVNARAGGRMEFLTPFIVEGD